jgi:hypothetical protein
MQARQFKVGPLALTNTLTTDIFNPGTTTGGTPSMAAPFDKLIFFLKRIRVVNKDSVARTFNLYIGASVTNLAGTEIAYQISVPVGSYVDLTYYNRPLTTSDYIVGGASAATALTIEIEGELSIA